MTEKHRTIEDTIYFWFAANDTSGSGDDGASPAAHVRLAGAAGGAAPVLSPTPTLLSHASFPPGCYEIAVAATVANGFVAGNEYTVFCTLLVDSQNPSGEAGSFILAPIISNIEELAGVVQSLTDLKDFADAGYDPATNKVEGVKLVDVTTLNSDMVTEPPTAVQNRQEMDSNSTELATIISRIPAALVGGAMDSDVSNMQTGAVDDILNRQLAESYAADTVAPTLAQALFLIQQSVGEFSITGTTLTVYEIDGVSVAATYTLDDATNPTSRLRTT